jgi:hypothetical protein
MKDVELNARKGLTYTAWALDPAFRVHETRAMLIWIAFLQRLSAHALAHNHPTMHSRPVPKDLKNLFVSTCSRSARKLLKSSIFNKEFNCEMKPIFFWKNADADANKIATIRQWVFTVKLWTGVSHGGVALKCKLHGSFKRNLTKSWSSMLESVTSWDLSAKSYRSCGALYLKAQRSCSLGLNA